MTKREFYEEYEDCSMEDLINLTYDYNLDIDDHVEIMDESEFNDYVLNGYLTDNEGLETWGDLMDFLNDVYDHTLRDYSADKYYLFIDGEFNSVVTDYMTRKVMDYIAEALEETQEDWYDESSDSYDELFDVDEELIEGFDAECEEEYFGLDDDLFLPGETISDAETVGDNGITLWL